MLVQVKRIRAHEAVLLIAVCLSTSLLGCHDRLINQNELAGPYEYYSGSKPQRRVCFVLNADGSYVLGDADEPLSQFPSLRTSPHGKWELMSDATGQKLIIGKISLPVGRTRTSIRVTVNDDLGMYCDLALRR